MNKARLQGLSAGIIFTTTIFTGFYYGTGIIEGTTPTTEEAKELLEEEGICRYHFLSRKLKRTVQQSKDADKEIKEKEASKKDYYCLLYDKSESEYDHNRNCQ